MQKENTKKQHEETYQSHLLDITPSRLLAPSLTKATTVHLSSASTTGMHFRIKPTRNFALPHALQTPSFGSFVGTRMWKERKTSSGRRGIDIGIGGRAQEKVMTLGGAFGQNFSSVSSKLSPRRKLLQMGST